MNIMFITKYPPIQGGESGKAYWLIKALGERGHNISVVSNCMEVENEYRAHLDENDIALLQPRGVKLYSSFPVEKPWFIPQTNPYCEKLVSLALEASEERNPDLVYSWYLVPYSVAGHTLCKSIGKKHLIQHAGSDITRLFNNPYLHTFLRRVVIEADAVLTSRKLENFFKEIGCRKVFTHHPTFPEEFNPYENKIDFKEELSLDINLDRTFLFLGKMSKAKGIDYLIEAFAKVRSEKHLIIAGGGNYIGACQKRISALGTNNIHFIGILPPWKIPRLIRNVKAVVIPEYNFGVPIHRSRIPFEAVLCGKTPIISNQVFHKYRSIASYAVSVDPPDTTKFAKTLEEVLSDADINKKVIEAYPTLRKEIGRYDDYVTYMENILQDAAS